MVGGSAVAGKNLKHTWHVIVALAALFGTGLVQSTAVAASQPVAWGTTASAPAGTLGKLLSVAAASSTDVLAVGGYNPGQRPTALLTRPYAEHWNGTGWTPTAVPLGQLYPSGEQAAQLNGVSEFAPGAGWAVGTVYDPSLLSSETLAYRWNGTVWTRTPTPDPAGSTLSNQLNAVAALTANDAWAVGFDGNYPETSLVVHWNGSGWRHVKVPDIGRLDAVTLAAGQVWIAGPNGVEQFNGTTWITLPLPPGQGLITGLADTSAGLWAVGYVDYICGEGGTCTSSYAALWNGTKWTVTPSGGGTGLFGVTAAGSNVLAASASNVLQLSLAGASPQVTPAVGSGQLTAITADATGKPWAVGWTTANGGTTQPAIINAPGIRQGGIIVTTGASGATVTWTGPVNGAGSTDQSGRFAVGGLPDGTYTVTASLPGCQPGIATTQVSAGIANSVTASISCPP